MCFIPQTFTNFAPMYLTHLTILNYKNIEEAELDFSPNINCFLGNNGEGKTNLLDAIHFLSLTRSMSMGTDSSNIRHGQESAMISGRYNMGEKVEEEITCALRQNHAKTFRRNKKAYKRLSEHIGLLPIILVSPNDHEIISGGSEERRRLMDIVISQANPVYMSLVARYNKALQQRNTILKQEEEPDDEIISIFEQIMAETGEQIYQIRSRFITEFTPIFQQYYTRISASHETVGLDYESHCTRGPLLDTIRKGRPKDRIMGFSLHGVHRDDLNMTIDGYPLRREGSQGQTKSFVISLKLAQFNFLRQAGNKTTPLLLLDDIFDKLDANRVEQIIGLAADETFGQLFITDTNRENLNKILSKARGGYKIFGVKGGEVTEQKSRK